MGPHEHRTSTMMDDLDQQVVGRVVGRQIGRCVVNSICVAISKIPSLTMSIWQNSQQAAMSYVTRRNTGMLVTYSVLERDGAGHV